jgi:hypothetical protein
VGAPGFGVRKARKSALLIAIRGVLKSQPGR